MKDRRKGFTLTELTVVLVIMAIITAIAVPFFVKYWKIAEFRKNESNARTVYLAAESKLTWYRSSGQWEQFQREVKKNGEAAVFEEASKLNGRIYTITLDADSYQSPSEEGKLVLQLLDDSAYDKSFLNGAVAIEIDMESGEVYSAFYGTRCKGLNYAEKDADGYLTMKEREYESRQKRLLGYYSVEDTVNVAALDPVRLRITTISLLNSEKLTLNWSSNAKIKNAVSYELTFYKADDKTKLFSLMMSPNDMGTKGWDGKSGSTSEMASFTLLDKDGNEKGIWDFPVSQSPNGYSLVLDAMMSAEMLGTLDAKSGSGIEETESTSILRLANVASELGQNQNIYATVKATAYAGSDPRVKLTQEYRDSEVVASNTAQTLYGDETKGTSVEICTWRHLSNIRYRNQNGQVTYTLTAKNMDWAAVGTGLYSLQPEGGDSILKPCWSDNGSEVADFPAIPQLSKDAVLKGEGDKTLLSNLQLGASSILDNKTADTIYGTGHDTSYLGLFAENNGTISDVTLADPRLRLTSNQEHPFTKLKGVGILAGRSEGTLQNITVEADKTAGTSAKAEGEDSDTVYVRLDETYGAKAAVGGIAGVLAKVTDAAPDEYQAVRSRTIEKLSMDGTMDVQLPAEKKDKNGDASSVRYGVGGIVGYAYLANEGEGITKLNTCENHADVTGNLFTGGIVGKLEGSTKNGKGLSEADHTAVASVAGSSNDGLILSSVLADADTFAGQYFGGITGYSYNAVLYDCETASGRAGGYSYDSAQRDKVLKGDYVGGIVGYGNYTILSNCETQKNGYVLGENYVGGIAGGLGNEVGSSIRNTGEVLVTTNRSYVIGKNYAGGITGINTDGVILENCVNNGVAAATEKYAGGIVGYNEYGAKIKDCVSYLSDYDSSIYNMIVDKWKATGDYVGGIAGYNNGAITFDSESQKVMVKSVSGIVAGGSYVGGIAGFNDVQGTLEAEYDLIGGRIHGDGDGVGGCFGLNASESVLPSELVIKPRSVEGRYYVGGVIGANVVELNGKEVTAGGLRAQNSLGVIRGQAFVGGVIGYQRTYRASQIKAESGKPILEALAAAQSDGNQRLLPGLDDSHVPTAVQASADQGRLVLTAAGNTDAAFIVDSNNIPIQAGYYAGGVLGYCERGSQLIIRNCRNAGNLSLYSRVGADDGVALGNYVKSGEVNNAAPDGAASVKLHFVGGIVGVNLENQIIDHCSNTGNMSGCVGIGGIVGLNGGYIYNCALSGNFGNAGLNYLGGIASINIQTSQETKNYTDKTYTAGTIEDCRTEQGRTVTGKDCVGGIVSWNLTDGLVKNCASAANVTAAGNCAGGTAGRNSGLIELADASSDTAARTVQGSRGEGVGGVVGVNEAGGQLSISGGQNSQVVAAGSGLTVMGQSSVGGIIGINEGSLGNEITYLVSQVKLVRASKGNAGGVVGTSRGKITQAVNRSDDVRADEGPAGGITAVNESVITGCVNYGNVTSSAGYVGGIVAENKGTIADSRVNDTNGGTVTLIGRGKDEMGAVCALNEGTIKGSMPVANVKLAGTASIFGGIAGRNKGIIEDTELTYMPELSGSGSLTVGGAVGVNENNVNHITANGLNFEGFTNYRYLGGITGQNGPETDGDATAQAQVTASSYSGTIKEGRSAAGNCYGGIVGINYAALRECTVEQIVMDIQGVYTATSTSTTEQKEALASHAGGVTGKNETNGSIENCVLTNNEESSLTAGYGMLGGIAGFNKGSISGSGSDQTQVVLAGAEELKNAAALDRINQNIKDNSLAPKTTYVDWKSNTDIEKLSYHQGENVTDGCLQIKLESNGNLGGITAYNSTSGSLERCVSGKWFLNNKSEAIGVGTGGIIGMNESEKDMRYLVNGAFVGRQIKTGSTNRFAGGIIGNQNNSTSSEWRLEYCVNYGMIYCYNSHYSGGIMGQWTGTGGTITNCRNYGSLQTTYGTAWIGASGGIVAQLYHAYENNEYNLIGCGNYGSIFTANGRKHTFSKEESDAGQTGANDSAGILGNITNYEATSPEKSQSYTVQILDCVNAPGVEIYSASMASGIFGFLSSDNPAGETIKKSTGNVVIRIERCRNFARVLKGAQYTAGIFGDRYGAEAWKNHTIVKDNYSVRMTTTYQSSNNSPIYSAQSGYSKSNGPGTISPESNRAHNYYMNGSDNGDHQFDDVSIGHGKTVGSGTKIAYSMSEWLRGLHANPSAFMYDIDKKKYFVADITIGYSVSGTSGDYIDENNNIIQKSTGRKLGKILYYLEDTRYTYKELENKSTVNVDDTVFVNARTSYRRLEGIKDNKLVAPKNVTASVEQGKIKVEITPWTLQEAGVDPFSTDPCDPFAYMVRLEDSEGHSYTHSLYTEDGSFELPVDTGLTGELKVFVRAVSMFDDVKDSDEVSGGSVLNPTLPDPDIRIQLIYTGPNNNNFAYQISLNNLDAYSAYDSWQTVVNIEREGNVVLTAENPIQQLPVKQNKNAIYQMTAQTTMNSGTTDIQASQVVSTAVSLPGGEGIGKPEYRLATAYGSEISNGSVTVSGTTLEDLTIEVSLTSSGAMTTPPIYRAELIGDWKDTNGSVQTDTVLAQTDILTVSRGTATGNFTALPEYVGDATNMRVRIWYAASGLGPVYTYDTGKDGGSADANYDMHQLLGVTEEEHGTRTEQWHNTNSTIWAHRGSDAGNQFCDYAHETDVLFTWLPKPDLVGADSTERMNPDANGCYTFEWDKTLAATEDAHYQVSLTGIDADGREVIIPTDGYYTDNTSRKLYIDGSDWNYQSVKLKVTRIGSDSGTTKYIGLSGTGTYLVKERLEAPGQPSVTNADENELNYQLSWAANLSEKGLKGYQAYIQTYGSDGSLTDAKTLGGLVPADKSGVYTETVNLEDYAGQKVVIYLKAMAVENSQYLDSLPGVTTELTIPSRLAAPKVSWKARWQYDKQLPVTAAEFLNSLQINLTAERDSIPPAGSAYLLCAYIYDSQEKAQSASLTNPGDYLAVYPVSYQETRVPVQMDVKSSMEYYHVLQNLSIDYAGKWIAFYARISSGSGSVSSAWTKAGKAFRLPYVKLDMPDISSDTVWTEVKAQVSDSPDIAGQPAELPWEAEHTRINWSSVDGAEVYEVTSTEKADISGGAVDLTRNIRIQESGDSVTVSQQWPGLSGYNVNDWSEAAVKKTDENTWRFDLAYPDGIAGDMAAQGYYDTPSGARSYYTVQETAALYATRNDDGTWSYSLELPDINKLTARDKADDGNTEETTFPNESSRIVSKVTVRANVKANLSENPADQSDAYAASERAEVELK